jgi:hypothetical protein
MPDDDSTDAGDVTSDIEVSGMDGLAEIYNPLATSPSKVIADTEGRRRESIHEFESMRQS